jgi:catechol 2,3-dioxygenase-like lactoylglutathione lyase family enzyme
MQKIIFKLSALLLLTLLNVAAYAQSQFTSKLIGVGVVTTDLEKSLNFYVNGIGMVKTGGFNIAEDFAKRSGLSNGVPFSVTVLKLENSADANEWKLITFGKKAAPQKQTFIQEGAGMQYITINVKSLKAVMDRLSALKVPFLGSTPTALDATKQFLFVQDPDGNFIELIGPM